MNKKLLSLTGLFLALGVLIAVNVVSAVALRSTQVDLTEDNLYSLSPGTRNILKELGEPVTLRFFFSEKLAKTNPGLLSYARRVQELLEQYAAVAGDDLDLQVIEPEPFSEEEDMAVGYGLTGARVNTAGDRLFFGLVGTNSVDDERAIAFFDPQKERLLEYEITQLVHELAHPEKPVVGIMSTLPLRGVTQNPQQPAQPWAVVGQIEQLFEVRWIEPTSAEPIDPELDVLMVVHPKELSDETLFAIDQYALGGGKVLAFVDALCNFDESGGQQNPMANRSSDPHQLLKAWGVELVASRMAADAERAQQIPSEKGPLYFPLFMGLDEENFSQDDFVTSGLSLVNMFTAGILEESVDAGTTVEPLVRTGTESQRIDTISMQFQPDLQGIVDRFSPEGERLTLAVRITGEIGTAFPEGKPGATAEEEGADEPGDGVEDPAAEEQETGDEEAAEEAGAETPEEEVEEPVEDEEPVWLTRSAGPFNAIVVADCDMLYDDLWATRQRDILGRVFLMARADNASFVLNCLENLSGSTDLISLRSRGEYQRPFKKKQELAQAAGERFREREKALQDKLADTEKRLQELQKEREDTGGALLTPEQEEAIQRFREEQVETRRDLREVQHQLQKDIESLGTRLKFLNLGALPLVILLGGLAFFLIRRT